VVVSKRERHEMTDGVPLHASLSADANEYETYKELTVSDLCHSLCVAIYAARAQVVIPFA
jgi:hypothetical protein